MFLVIKVDIECEDLAVDEDEDDAGDACARVQGVVVCVDTRAVCAAIQGAQQTGDDWSVWEVVGARTHQRAVTFLMDGNCPYDVTIS